MSVFQKNKPFFLFLLRFLGTYVVLSVLYWAYLSQFNAETFETDGITRLVSRQAVWLTNTFGEEAKIEPHPKEASYIFYVNNTVIARVIEGCNAVSVMILFAAFIMAFYTTFKRTAIYIVIGVFVIHLLNILRIALLNIALYYYKDSGPILHDILFPLFIYGVVFVLWVLWIKKFKGNAKQQV